MCDLLAIRSNTWLDQEEIFKKDVDGLLSATREFGFCIQACARSTFLASVINGLWLKLGPTRRVAYAELFKPQNPTEKLTNTRESLLQALRRRNPDEAREAMVEDIDKAIPVILRFGQFKDADGAPDRIGI